MRQQMASQIHDEFCIARLVTFSCTNEGCELSTIQIAWCNDCGEYFATGHMDFCSFPVPKTMETRKYNEIAAGHLGCKVTTRQIFVAA